MGKYGWLDWARDEVRLQQLKAAKETARNTRPERGKWQRLPDGTWGYPPEPTQADAQTAAYQQGWREGWAAGYAAAQEAAKSTD